MIISLTFSCPEFTQIPSKTPILLRKLSKFRALIRVPLYYADLDLYVEVIRKDVQVSNAI